MRIFASAAGVANRNLLRLLAPNLRGLGFDVRLSRELPSEPPDADVWFVAPFDHRTPWPAGEVGRVVSRYRGTLIDFSKDDALEIQDGCYPGDVRARVDYWCRVAYREDYEGPEHARGKLACLPPFLPKTIRRTCRPSRWSARKDAVLFVGALTGSVDPDQNLRIRALRILRASGIPFAGGLYPNSDNRNLVVPEDVRGERCQRYGHYRALHRIRYGLALPGNNPLTYRFFECLAAGCLCFSTDLGRYRWLNGSLAADVHYASVNEDLSNLADRIEAFRNDPAEAAAIAAAGHQEYLRSFRHFGWRMNPDLVARFVRQFKPLAEAARFPRPGRGGRLADGVFGLLQAFREFEYSVKERRLRDADDILGPGGRPSPEA